ncbi:hypothetical protein VOLCADRAFT_97214, partial [Volvox carteri f. nagariensis]
MLETQGFVLVAHRGNSACAPENTLASFDSALDAGFPHFETDCQLTADGIVVILHDEQLGRTTPGARGAVAEAAWGELHQLDAGSWFGPAFARARIPLLSEVLQRYRGRAHVHLELKSTQPELPAAVAREVSLAGWWVPGAAPLLPDLPAAEAAAAAAPAPAPALQPPLPPAGFTAPALILQQQLHERDFGVPGLTITSFHLGQLRRSLQMLPEVVHGWLVHELTDEVIQ